MVKADGTERRKQSALTSIASSSVYILHAQYRPVKTIVTSALLPSFSLQATIRHREPVGLEAREVAPIGSPRTARPSHPGSTYERAPQILCRSHQLREQLFLLLHTATLKMPAMEVMDAVRRYGSNSPKLETPAKTIRLCFLATSTREAALFTQDRWFGETETELHGIPCYLGWTHQ